ncbi:MAG: ABC transporter ATP-binding protein [Firmicutes bacterium]|nr:ABC transporter ATP-binding protein [Bacillota bacterium]
MNDQTWLPAEVKDRQLPFIRCEGLVRIYKALDLEVMALQGLDLTVKAGEMVAIIGSSGSGKTTLLNILGALDTPSAGLAMVGGWNLARMSPRERVLYQRQVVGFVWQNVGRNLVPYLTALENVEVPMILNGKPNRAWARELLEVVGLERCAHHRPSQMSSGQLQRVAIAIGLANRPKLLLADEPTGALDSKSARQVLQVMRDIRATYGVTIVLVTHDRMIVRAVDRYVEIRDGRIVTETVRRAPGAVKTWLDETETHDEYVVLDAAGRLQLPIEYRKALGISTHARIMLREREIVIRPKD